ncbi:MAG TPA: MFS transporter [Nocardioides sp.]|nr:MFS transporter [Nocardioides sp.]
MSQTLRATDAHQNDGSPQGSPPGSAAGDSVRRVRALSAGSFALGTDGFVLAGILPLIADDLDVTVASAGLLLTVFALTYGISAPLLGPLSGQFERRTVLVASMAGFIIANVVAACAPSFGLLLAARAAAAVCAGVYSPTALGVAVQLSPPERRGRAVAGVLAGMTVALIVGVPAGSLLADLGSWRTTFVAVAVLGTAALVALMTSVPRVAPLSVAPLAARLAPLRERHIAMTLVACFAWQVAMFVPFTFLAEILGAAGAGPTGISALLLVYGASAWAGNRAGGAATDRWGGHCVVTAMLAGVLASLTLLAVLARLDGGPALTLTLVVMAVWGFTGWGIVPAQANRLVAAAPAAAQEVLSLNTASIYLGIGVGALTGGVVLRSAGLDALAPCGAALVGLVLAVSLLRSREAS